MKFWKRIISNNESFSNTKQRTCDDRRQYLYLCDPTNFIAVQTIAIRCADEDITGVLSTPILAEVMHQLMLSEARDNGWIHGANPAKQLSHQPEIVQKLSRYEDSIRDMLALGLRIEPLVTEDFINAMNLQRRFELLTNDALLVAMMQRLRITSLASADQIFSRV